MNKYGLIGFPLGHSFSEKFFTEKFAREKIDAQYRLYPMETVDKVHELIADADMRGFNVTIPYKQQIMPLLDELDEEAANVGAVNVVKIIRENGTTKLKGYNSDIYGFYESIRPFIKPQHKKALILGTGGASKAVCAMLKKLNIEYVFVSRSPKEGQLSYDQIDSQTMNEYKVVVNTTPLGMSPNLDTCPPLPYELFTPEHLAFDLVYNPETTKFLRLAAEHGAATKNGLEMLHLQAIRAWEIWTK
ncbi:MAG: shikimate dehydrogenase [Bacteroidales bacterium]|jgi:shikimate dehydrogenase|nr:shikimate dehydrogenase [Bacteroidales bacterium]